jgi:hypothetical protein
MKCAPEEEPRSRLKSGDGRLVVAADRPPARLIVSALLLAAAATAQAQASEARLDAPDIGYSQHFARIVGLLSSRRVVSQAPIGVELTCIATPEQDSYVGFLKRTTIHASLSAVEGVLDDVAHYRDLFPGTVDVKVISGSSLGARFATLWEQRVPVFFLPNVRYELSHVVDKSVPGMGVYLYRLRHGDRLIASDGLVVLEALGQEVTQFTEYGFFHPRSEPVPASVVWRESLRGAFLSIVGIALKAENPDWSYERIAAEGERRLASNSARLERCLANRSDAMVRASVLSGVGVVGEGGATR